MTLFKKGQGSNRATQILSKHGVSAPEEKTEEQLAAEKEEEQLAAEAKANEGKAEEELAAEKAVAEKAAAEAAKAQEGKTEEEIAAEKEAAERAEAEKAKANEGKTEEEIAAEAKENEEKEKAKKAAAEKAEAEAQKNKPVELTEESMLSYLSEKLKRKIENWDDLTPKEKEMDPEVKQILDWKEKTGLSLSKWSEYNKDYSKVGDLEIAREILAQKNPTFTAEELSYSLKRFIFDEDVDEELIRIPKSIALKEYAHKGRQEFEKNRLDLKESKPQDPSLTQEQQDDIAFAQEAKKGQEQSVLDNKTYGEDLNKAALALDGLNLKLTDDLTIKYDIPEGDKKTLAKSILEMPHWHNEDGSINHNNIALDGIKVRNFDSIMDAVLKQGIAIGKEEMIQGKPNSKTGLDEQSQGGGETKGGNIKEVVANITGSNKPKLRFGQRTSKK